MTAVQQVGVAHFERDSLCRTGVGVASVVANNSMWHTAPAWGCTAPAVATVAAAGASPSPHVLGKLFAKDAFSTTCWSCQPCCLTQDGPR